MSGMLRCPNFKLMFVPLIRCLDLLGHTGEFYRTDDDAIALHVRAMQHPGSKIPWLLCINLQSKSAIVCQREYH